VLAPLKDLKVNPAPVPTFSPSSLTQSAVSARNSLQTAVINQKPLQVNVNVNDGKVKDLVNATYKEPPGRGALIFLENDIGPERRGVWVPGRSAKLQDIFPTYEDHNPPPFYVRIQGSLR